MCISRLAAVVLLTGAVSASPQDVFVSLCRTHFSVTDAHGNLVTTLDSDDVTIFDNDVPQRPDEFESHPESPISLAVLVDRSSSMGARLPRLSAVATTFAFQALHTSSDRALVVAFDANVYLVQDWTSDGDRIASAISSLTSAGGTSLFDALFKSSRDRLPADSNRHNIVLLISDGEDTTSAATFDQALEMTTLSRAVIYAIGAPTDSSLNPRALEGHHVLETLTALTGGRVFFPESNGWAPLDALLTRVREEIRYTFSVTYYLSQPPDGTFHRLRIVPRDKSLIVHAPSGYYARALASS
ncbi:MAG TPA: VWA domain-containing protein [Vicinamibacterales bacterium]|jgi:Ca-activated chloride channel family protein